MIRHYALFDGALVHHALCASPLFTNPAIAWYIALLSGKRRRLVGPILIDMDLLETEDDTIKLAVEEVLNGFPGRLHLSRLQSEQDLSTLAHHLERFTRFYDEDNLLLGFRFADTRILTHLPMVLTPQQWRAMTAPIQQWSFLDRHGEEVVLALPEDRTSVIPENKPFALSMEQLDIFSEAGEPDYLLNNLKLTPRMMENSMYEYWHLAQQCVQIWRQSGSGNREVLRQFALEVFNSNGQVLKEKDWVTLLSNATLEDKLNA